MKSYHKLLFLLLPMFVLHVFGQTGNAINDTAGQADKEEQMIENIDLYNCNDKVPDFEDGTIMRVETMPTFKGGNISKFVSWAQSNIKYPEGAKENKIEGKVFVQFIVNMEGKVIDEKIVRSLDPELDGEALRVIRSSPLWEPAKQRDKPVDVRFTIPVVFRLNE